MDMGKLEDIGKFSEGGRGVPVTLSRPGSALPCSPIVRQQYAANVRTQLGWAQGVTPVAVARLEPISCSLAPDATPAAVAERLIADDAGYVPVCHEGRLVGVIYEEDLLRSLARGTLPADVSELVSTLIPTCALHSTLVDAVRLMLSCYLRKIPVVDEGGALVGLLTLAEAAASADKDPTVADLLERFAVSPSLFARRMR
jgi:CBS-domain-containing membrane protein